MTVTKLLFVKMSLFLGQKNIKRLVIRKQGFNWLDKTVLKNKQNRVKLDLLVVWGMMVNHACE